MLESLDQVPWTALWHAYGNADDIPGQIRDLLSDDPEVRQRSLFAFTCNIFHQGSRYPATVAAIPFFMELLSHDDVPDRAGILDLLAYLATGYPEGRLPPDYVRSLAQSSNPLLEIPEPEDQWTSSEQIRDCSLLERQCYAEVAAGVPTYKALLADEDPTIAIAASFLVGFFPSHGFLVSEQLLQIAQEKQCHDLVRSSALMSLGYLRGGNVCDTASLYCDTLIAQPISGEKPVPILFAAATYFLLAVHEFAPNIDRSQLKRLANGCLKQGIEPPAAEFYDERMPPDDVESAEDYYEAFLAPVCAFPWEIEQSIQGQVLRQFKRGGA